ncbi:uncharacterized protein LOC133308147 [Gastrolobium bilobum]|uniref:uncharacterized protein LOC133308147 n=1 Tax=Gastrolobium bilobum TaxID=150636 RepID=UPI002AB0CFA6|nr:uncharacterized protein LOC133308147 [Gastrolobium bilobum]
MDSVVDSLNNAYQDFIAAANVLECKRNVGALKTTTTDTALEKFKQKWEVLSHKQTTNVSRYYQCQRLKIVKGYKLMPRLCRASMMTTTIASEDVHREEVKLLKALSGRKHRIKFHDACEDANKVT